MKTGPVSQVLLAEAQSTPGAALRPLRDLDAIAVVRASQALSSERDPARLHAKVESVVRELTGASRVVVALWDEDTNDWVLRPGNATATPLDASGPHALPMSVFRHAERTREPLLLKDAPRDHRFAADPYFAGLAHCSFMIVPIVWKGAVRAMLAIESRSPAPAFDADRMDSVVLLASQLAVSLESAQLYERLESMVVTQARSGNAADARRAEMAEVATNVLHNVGNVLNSVNVSTHVLAASVRESRSARVADLAALLEQNQGDLGSFFGAEGKGRLLPRYVRELADALAAEREQLLVELARLGASVEHVKNVVAMQQSFAGASGVREPALVTELVDDALRLQEHALVHHGIEVRRDYASVQPMALDRTRLMQILVNLVENARHAMQESAAARRLHVAVAHEAGGVRVSVTDTGCGIEEANLARIFSHGFTTKREGHGFGLHSCALAAREMGGTLTVHSEGAGKGATFTLRLPLGDA